MTKLKDQIDAVQRGSDEADAELAEAIARGDEQPQSMTVTKVDIAPGEAPQPVAVYDSRVALIRERLEAGKVKMVVLVTVENEGKGDGYLAGRTEVLSDSVSMNPAILLWSAQNDLPGILANNVYEAVGRAITEYIKVVTDHTIAHIEKSLKATEN